MTPFRLTARIAPGRVGHVPPPAKSPLMLSIATLWVPFTIIAALGQVARNAMQRQLTGPLGTWGATNIRFLFGFPFSLVFFAVVIAATGDDEDNLVVSWLAKQEFGVPRVVARVNHPKNEWLFNENWGVDLPVSTPHLITALVEEAVSVGRLVRILQFEGGNVRLVELTLAEDSPVVDKAIRDLDIPRDATIVAVVRGEH